MILSDALFVLQCLIDRLRSFPSIFLSHTDVYNPTIRNTSQHRDLEENLISGVSDCSVQEYTALQQHSQNDWVLGNANIEKSQRAQSSTMNRSIKSHFSVERKSSELH